jgi:predicted nucleotidyltransferase
MEADELLAEPKQLQAACQQYGIARLDYFGSAARRELGPQVILTCFMNSSQVEISARS